MDYSSAVFSLPFPNTFYEDVASEFMPVKTFCRELFFYDILRRDAGMVGTREPKDFISRHAFPTEKDILQNRIEGMAHMERTGDVWRGYYQRIGDTVRILARLKIFVRDPEFIPFFFDTLRIKALV
jgi:hypothetical protein